MPLPTQTHTIDLKTLAIELALKELDPNHLIAGVRYIREHYHLSLKEALDLARATNYFDFPSRARPIIPEPTAFEQLLIAARNILKCYDQDGCRPTGPAPNLFHELRQALRRYE